MGKHDIRVTAGRARFGDVYLDHPLLLAGGSVDRVTMATVELDVSGIDGVTSRGIGTSMLSVPWSWPSTVPFSERDRQMRALTTALAHRIVGMPSGTPFAHWATLYRVALREPEAEGMPPLAMLLCIAAVDNALHDGWSKAADIPLYKMYTSDVLTTAGRALIDPKLSMLTLDQGTARSTLPVQYVVGLADPIDLDSALAIAVLRDGVRHLKLKLSGDPAVDAERVGAIHTAFAGIRGGLDLSLDANEGYRHSEGFRALVSELHGNHPTAWDAITYIEQPVPREIHDISELYPPTFPEGERRPIILDEGHILPEQLRSAITRGWSGIAIKASKGQSLGILSHAYARAHDLIVVTQDLTAVDRALEHSAGLAAALPFSFEAFECNSLQYAPSANTQLAVRKPELVTIRDGTVRPGPAPRRGLYEDDTR